jgi:DNA-binding NarL/FixJ family response regulator
VSVADDGRGMHAASTAKGSGLAGSRERIRVLLADDHRILCEKRAWCSPRIAISWERPRLRWRRSCARMSWCSTSGCRGWEDEREHRISRDAPACKVLVLSEYDNQEYVIEALGEAGAAGYLVKTDAAAELLAAVRAVHSGRRYLSPSIAPIVLGRLRPARLDSGGSVRLTRRARGVLRLIGEGATTKEVAQRLGISRKTAQVRRENLKQKLDLRSTAAMVRYAIKRKFIRID